MSAPPIIELRDVSYHIDGQIIVDRVTWQVDRGQHWTILGRNGSGKTTLLRLACGYLWPNAGGTILREGQELLDLSDLRRSIGWVTSQLESRIPLRENVLDTVVSGKFSAVGLNRLLYERPTAADYSVARQKLDGVGMSDLADRPFGVLSQGERQKTLLARAQMAAPLLLVLDEPCVGLDPGSRESFLSALETIAQDENSPSLLLVTHHIEEIVPALLNTLVMDAGRIIDRGPTADLLNLESANRLYDGRVQRIVWENGRCWPICG